KVGDKWTEEVPTVKNVGDNKTSDIRVTVKNYETLEGQITATVTARNVTLTSGTDSKEYDDTPLKAETDSVSGDGIVKDEGASYSNFASITEVGGPINNTFNYTLNEGTLKENYNITPAYGTLTVINSKSGLKFAEGNPVGYTGMYDGEDHNALTSLAV